MVKIKRRKGILFPENIIPVIKIKKSNGIKNIEIFFGLFA
tara:strand:+ start:1104 stop:1223 length:120 start_codon:yes stop_codon:yes gene_type:complete